MLTFHEIANVFPMFPEDKMASLAESIKNDGLDLPIILFEGKILDGRNRYRAAQRAEVVLGAENFEDFEGDWDAAVKFVARRNIERREFGPHDRTLWAAKLSELGRGRPSVENPQRCGILQRDLAAQFGVGVRSIQSAKRVLDKGVPELVEALEKNEIRFEPAAELTKLPPDKQREALAGGPEAVKDAVREVRRQPLSERQRAMRQGASVTSSLFSLAQAIQAVRDEVSRLARADASALSTCSEQLMLAGQELRTLAEWVEGLQGGGVTDEMLKRFMGEETA